MFRPIANHLSVSIEFDFEGDSVSLRLPIGYCSDSNRMSLVSSTILTRFDGRVEFGFFHEMGFCIEVISLDYNLPSISTTDRDIAREFIPETIRGSITKVVGLCYSLLIRRIEPNTI